MANQSNRLSVLCTYLKEALQVALDENHDLQPIFQIIDELVAGFRNISMNDTIIILRGIINPYSMRSLDHKSLVLAVKMVKFMFFLG